tara:strand:+ start:21244 stop:22365 length:1122 start_codon:yes stop_codon:yes gene_type:complete
MNIKTCTFSYGIVTTMILALCSACNSGIDSSLPEVKRSVDYSKLVSEVKIGIPDDTSKIKYTTDVHISVQYNKKKLRDLRATYDVTQNNFNPQNTHHYKIAHPKLSISNSSGNQYEIAFYLAKRQKIYLSNVEFVLFATLDNIAYNTISFNQSHTAYYLRGAYINDHNVVSDYVHNMDKMHGVLDSKNMKWNSAHIILSDSSVERTPSTTIYPCYGSYRGYICNMYDAGQDNVNLAMPILFQPMATVGYKDYDWYNYGFMHPDLQDLTPNSKAKLNDKYHQIAMKEVEEVLFNLDQNKNDIGWYGFPVSVRNNMIRYHTVRLYMNFIHDPNIKTADLVILEDDIKIKNFDASDKALPVSIGNDKLVISAKLEP